MKATAHEFNEFHLELLDVLPRDEARVEAQLLHFYSEGQAECMLVHLLRGQAKDTSTQQQFMVVTRDSAPSSPGSYARYSQARTSTASASSSAPTSCASYSAPTTTMSWLDGRRRSRG